MYTRCNLLHTMIPIIEISVADIYIAQQTKIFVNILLHWIISVNLNV